MSIDKKSVKEKLAKLEQIIKLLEKFKKVSREDFLVDFTVNSAAQHNLVLGIEIIADIGHHFLTEVYQLHPKEYKEIIEMLGEYGIVPKKFAKENMKMASFRNLIIHQYMEVDMKKVYQNLQKAPDIFRKFLKYYLKFLEKQK